MLEDLKAIFLSLPAITFLGVVVGSFLNVVIHRLPIMVERAALAEGVEEISAIDAWARAGANAESSAHARRLGAELGAGLDSLPELTLNSPPSSCPTCGHRIRWFENVPVLSWLLLRGRCSNCGAGISARYVVVEIGTALVFAAMSWRSGAQIATLAWVGFAATLIAASVIDWETTLLPDALTTPLLWAGLLVSVAGLTIAPSAAVLGAAAGYLIPRAISMMFERLSGTVAIAPGDFKLLAAIGAWVGWQLVLPVLAVALILGALVVLLRSGRTGIVGRHFPFGPYLGVVAIVAALIGPHRLVVWL